MKTNSKEKKQFVQQKDVFGRFAAGVAHLAGHPVAFGVAVLIVVAWGMVGSVFQFSNTWQLFINTLTTIVTFLMVFVIQNTQNRDSRATQIKLDELIRVSKGHNALLDLEELSQDDLDRIQKRYEELAEKARKDLQAGRKDSGSPEVKDEGGR